MRLLSDTIKSTDLRRKKVFIPHRKSSIYLMRLELGLIKELLIRWYWYSNRCWL